MSSETKRIRRSVPEPWASAMERAGYTHGTQPSIRALAEAAQRHTGGASPEAETVRRWIFGERVGTMNAALATALAGALGVPVNDVLEWSGSRRVYGGEWRPPASAALLTSEQRRLLDQLVRMLAAGNQEREGGGTRGDAAPMNAAVTEHGGDLVIEAGVSTDDDAQSPQNHRKQGR